MDGCVYVCKYLGMSINKTYIHTSTEFCWRLKLPYIYIYVYIHIYVYICIYVSAQRLDHRGGKGNDKVLFIVFAVFMVSLPFLH